MPDLTELLAFTRDRVRVDAYLRAIRRVVSSKDIVLDFGAGLGVFSVAAALAGARKVFAVEAAPVAGAIEALAAANGVADRVEVIVGRLQDRTPPARASVCIYDDLAVMDLCGDCADAIADARARWLLPDARWIPDAVELWCAPARVRAPVAGVADPAIDVSALDALAATRPWRTRVRPGQLVGTPVRVATLPLRTLDAGGLEAARRTRAQRGGRITAVAAWVTLRVARGLAVDTGPDAPPTVYPHIVFPLANDLRVAVDERLGLELRYAAPRAVAGRHRLWSWRVTSRAGEAEASTFPALPLFATAE